MIFYKKWIKGNCYEKKIVLSLVFICCSLFADFFDDGIKAYDTKEYTKAADLYKKACDGEYASGCVALGFMYDKGQDVRQNNIIAKKLFGKAY